MTNSKDNVFQYEEIFSLMLNMYHQFVFDKNDPQNEVKSVEKYFYRLTRLALGEFEFARRLAYEGIKVNRLTHYEQLSKIYKQHAPEDFLINQNGITSFVDVKFFDSKRLIKFIPLNSNDIKRALKNKDKFKIDKGLFGIKRFNKWYLIDSEKLNTFFKDLNKEVQYLPVEKLIEFDEKEILQEKPITLNIGAKSGDFNGKQGKIIAPNDSRLNTGIDIYSIGTPPKNRKEMEFKVWNEKDVKKEVLAIDYQSRILWTTYNTLNFEIRNLLFKGDIKQIDEIPYFTDILPTEFTVTDSLFTTESIKVEYGKTPKETARKYLNSLYASNWIIDEHTEYLLGKIWVLLKSKILKE